jgi:D-alanine transaminase
MIVYFNGRFVAKEKVKVSPDDRGFLFADGVYEVIRVYRGRLFKLDEHMARLRRSLDGVRIPRQAAEKLPAVIEEVMDRNRLGRAEATVYIQITRGVAPRKHPFPEPAAEPTVYVAPSPVKAKPGHGPAGASAILAPDIRWTRCDIKSVALLPNVLANQRARECGAEEALFVRDGVVTEGTHTNVCAVFGGELVTHPLTNHILAGITRGVVLDLCQELGLPHREAPILEEDLKNAEELMIIGTTTEVTPVIRLNGRKVGSGKPGPVARRLKQAFDAVAKG